ncbi:MAG: UvrD-helicase domain-containing protein, partial [Gillisia sp.]
MTEFKPLDKESVKLEDASLVEASAGTGKTYSIGLLVLRLILEKNVPVSRILLVTFTNAAVAELAARVRRFIREAIKAAESGSCNEETIQNYIEEQEDKQEVINRLKKALSELDEASIQTIHSFCQEALNEFALDSGQEFGLELQPGILGIAQDFINDFWRKNVATLPVEDLEEWGDDLNLKLFNDAVKDHLGGKEFAFGVDVRPEHYKEGMQAFLNSCTAGEQDLSERIQQARINNFTDDHKKVLINQIRTNKQAFFEYLTQEINPRTAAYIRNCMEQLFKEEREEALGLVQQHQNVVNTLIGKCIK